MLTNTMCVVTFLLFVETTQWCCHVGMHAYMKHRDRRVLSCKTINFKMLTIACGMTFLLALAIFLWVIYIVTSNSAHAFPCLIISSGVYLSHIHLLAILGRCSELKISEFPPISRQVSRRFISKISILGINV